MPQPAYPQSVMLDSIRQPSDLRHMSGDQLRELAAEIRDFLVRAVSARGGHLGPNLGVVELTIALHRAFDSPTDRIIWDTGHQAYVHKLLTGRQADFANLRTFGGLSGYPSRSESPHDVIENSHASTALGYALGLAEAQRAGHGEGRVVAVVDVGIAEQVGVTMAAGMAMRGLRPVCAIYSTFLQRAFDQVVMDVSLHRLPVIFVIDRSGVTGEDGPSH